MVPAPLKTDFHSLFIEAPEDCDHHKLVKAADKDLPEAGYFLETFLPSFRLTLDELFRNLKSAIV